MSTLEDHVNSKDPLSADALKALLIAREENTLVDYKLSFEDNDREWLEVTKDVMAFANTRGGYLVFGVRGGAFQLEGVDTATEKLLTEPNNWMQKLNRFVEPHFTALRCRTLEHEGKRGVVVFVPPSLGQTHMITKEGAFKQQSGASKVVLHIGTFYVRRSGANHLADARDLDAVVARRIDHFRESLLGKIARVVKASTDTEVLVVKQKSTQNGKQKFEIQDAPDDMSLEGKVFSVTPETTEQEIETWIALRKKNKRSLPPAGAVWKWYRDRHNLKLPTPHKIRVASYCLILGVPCFFWLQKGSAKDIKEMLAEVLKLQTDPGCVSEVLAVSAFLGKKFHKAQASSLGKYADRVQQRDLSFPTNGPRHYYEAYLMPNYSRTEKDSAISFEQELDQIADSAIQMFDGQPNSGDRSRAQKLDCKLYAQDNRYEGEDK